MVSMLRFIHNGTIPLQKPDFILQKGETCLYRNDQCEVYQEKQITSRVNFAGPRARIRIAKGLSYNAGSYRIGTNSETIEVSKGVGVVNLTDKRILFKSNSDNFTIAISSIIDIEPYIDAVIITKSIGKPFTFAVNNGIAFYKIFKAIVEFGKDLKYKQAEFNSNKLNDLESEIIRLWKSGEKLMAVKLYHDNTKAGLKESKDYVETLVSTQ